MAYGQASSEVARLWHRRYCHLSATNLRIVSNLVKGMAPLQATYVASTEGALCHPCIVGRMHAEPFRAKDAATGKLELVHMDLVGPLPDSLGKARHIVAVLDDATELVVVSALNAKSEAGKVVQAWIAQLELQAGARVKRVRCEGAGELISAEMRASHARRWIRLELTAAHTPQQNVKAERLNLTLMERVRSMSAEAGLCEELWAEEFMAVVYTCNRAPTSDGKATPHERFYGKTPDAACLRVWGSLAYALKPTGQQRKLQPKTMLGRMVGYVAGGQAYRVYNPASRKVVVRRNVVWTKRCAHGGVRVPHRPSWLLTAAQIRQLTPTTHRTPSRRRLTALRANSRAPDQLQANLRRSTKSRKLHHRTLHVASRIPQCLVTGATRCGRGAPSASLKTSRGQPAKQP